MFVSLFVCLFCCVLRAAEIRFLLRRTAQLAIPHIQIQTTLLFAANFSQAVSISFCCHMVFEHTRHNSMDYTMQNVCHRINTQGS